MASVQARPQSDRERRKAVRTERLERGFFLVWGSLGTILVVLSALDLFHGVKSDAFIVIWLGAFLGLPAWLISAALTLTRWSQLTAFMRLINNLPWIIAVAAVVAVAWAKP